MKAYFSILLFLFSTGLIAQQGIDDVDYKYDKEYLEMLVQAKIDSFRESKSLSIFEEDDILNQAAEDQTFYILR